MSSSDVEARAREVISKLVGKPELFYAVLRIVADEYEVLSPWSRPGGSSGTSVRLDLAGAAAATVYQSGTTEWAWQTFSENGTAVTEQGAQGMADQVLRSAGFLLG